MKIFSASHALGPGFAVLSCLIFAGCGVGESGTTNSRTHDVAARREAHVLKAVGLGGRGSVTSDAICRQGAVFKDRYRT